MKNKLNVLLVCGAGASSSFMAAKMRVAAKKRGIELTIHARSESEISNFIGEVDAIMVGPHLYFYYEELKKNFSSNCLIVLMNKDYYSKLDGDKALDHLEKEFSNLHD